jgi:uncharacterized membrane protein
MPTNGEDTSNKKNELINHSVLTNEFINLFTTNFTAKQKENVLKIIEEKDETAHSENGNVVDFFEKLTEQVIGGIEEDQKIDLLRKEKEELEIKIGLLGDKDRDSVPDLEAAQKKLMEIGQQRKIKMTSFDKQIKELKSLTPEQALHSVELGSLHHLSKIQRFELKRQLGGNKVARITLDREVEELRKRLTKLKKHKLNQVEQVSTDLKKLDEIENVNEKFLTAEEKEKVREIHQIENIAASHSIERTPSFSKLVINKDDNTDTRLMKYATLKLDRIKLKREIAINEGIIDALNLENEIPTKIKSRTSIPAHWRNSRSVESSSPETKKENVSNDKRSSIIKEVDLPDKFEIPRPKLTRKQSASELNESSKEVDLPEKFKIPRPKLTRRNSTPDLNLKDSFYQLNPANKKIVRFKIDESDVINRFTRKVNENSVEAISGKELKTWNETAVHNLQAKAALVEQRIRLQKEMLKMGPLSNFLLDPTMKKNEKKGRLAEIKNELAENEKLFNSIQVILQDKEKLAEYVEKEKPKDKNELVKGIEKLTSQTTEIESKVAELKGIDYKDLKNKWYHVFSRPSFYAFLGRQALWLTPLIFFNAIPGYVQSTMPSISFAENGARIISSLKGMLVGTYVAQKLLYAAPKVIPRITARVSQGLRNKFPKTMDRVDRVLEPLSRGKQKIKQMGQTVKAKTVTPMVKKAKQSLHIGNSEKLTPEQKANRANGLDPHTGEKLPLTTRAKNATQDFLKSAGKRVWNNKWTIASMIALTTVFTVTGGTFLAAAFPAFAGSLFGAVVLAATTAFVICGATLLADKLILKPIQNRLASRENKNRDQVVMERFAQDKEKGQHFSLDKAFSENVASIAKTENKEQTITQEQTNKKENTIDTRKQEIQPSVSSQFIVKTEEQRKTTVAIVHQENNKRPFKEVTSDGKEKARRASISGAQEKNKNEKQQVVI